MKARIIKATRKYFEAFGEDGNIYRAVVRGKLVSGENEDQSVKVGDWVELSEDSSDLRAIEKIYPRQTQLSRGRGYKKHIIASNIDQLLIIMSTKQPNFRTSILDRYLIIAERNAIPAFICLNKIDLVQQDEYRIYQEYYNRIGYQFYMISALQKKDVDQLADLLRGKVTALFGHSGVGKSSLVKAIQPELDIKIGDVSQKTQKGRHTTTHVQMYYLPNVDGFVIDTPGIKELGIGDILKSELKDYFIEFKNFADECQFNDCEHIHEPGCAVREAAEKGDILTSRYENYLAIYSDLPSREYEWEQGKVRPV